jgi:hypothetical protein
MAPAPMLGTLYETDNLTFLECLLPRMEFRARWAPPAFKDELDRDTLDGAVHLVYDIPAIQVEYVRHEEPVLNTGFWRGVGVTHNNFVIESFIDELALASNQDPVAYRRALLGKSSRALQCWMWQPRRLDGAGSCRPGMAVECLFFTVAGTRT